MSDKSDTPDTIVPVHNAREEVALTEPAKAPLPDVTGPAHAFSPVDLPEPDQPLSNPLAWAFTVIASAGLFLALFNADSIRGWAYELKPGATNEKIVTVSEGWFDMTAMIGLDQPTAIMRKWWKSANEVRFPGQAQTETGPEAEAAEPVK